MAPSFTDSAGRTWTLRIDIAAARRIRERLAVDILDLNLGMDRLSNDVILMVDVLWLLVEQQAEQQKVTDEQFGQSLHGDVLGAAIDAYLEALLAFCPPRQRQLLTSMKTLSQESTETLMGILTNAEQMVKTMRGTDRGRRSPGSPDSSASTPELTPSAN